MAALEAAIQPVSPKRLREGGSARVRAPEDSFLRWMAGSRLRQGFGGQEQDRSAAVASAKAASPAMTN
jgi:hypothetical protein